MSDFDIFDCHHHVADPRVLVAQGDSYNDRSLKGLYSGKTPEQAIEAERALRTSILDRDGVRQAAVIVGHGYDRPDGQASTEYMNDMIAAYSAAQPDRYPVALGVVEPLHGDVSLAELERCKEIGLTGISLHPVNQGVSMDHPRISQYVRKMGEIGLVPVLHGHFAYKSEAMYKVVKVARENPEVDILVLDALASNESTNESALAGELCPNLVFDTSLSPHFDHIERLIPKLGAERIVFGTDLYSPPLFGQRISNVRLDIADSALADEQKALVLGGNARRLFGVTS